MKKLINKIGFIYNMRMREFLVIALMLVLLTSAFSLNRVTIFQDNFENTTRSTNIWNLGSGWSIDVIDGIDNSMYSLFNQNSNWGNVSTIINTTGYKNIEVSWTQYKYYSGSWGSSSELKVYANNTQLMDETRPYQIVGIRHYSLGSQFDNSLLNLTFSGKTGSSDYIIVDNVKVTGEIISHNPVIINDGYTTKTSTNSYACIWVNAIGVQADNVSYAVATVTSPSGNTFTVMLTDNGPCNILNNVKGDNIYSGEFYIGDSGGNYTVDSIRVYSLTGNYSTVNVDGIIQSIKPSVYHKLVLTDSIALPPYLFDHKADLTICSTYPYVKHFNKYYVDIPNFLYVDGYSYNGTNYNNNITISNDGNKQFVISNVSLQPYSCINYTVFYSVDPTTTIMIDQMNFYYTSLYNTAYNYWNSYLRAFPENTMVSNILQTMSFDIDSLNNTEYLIKNHPSKVSQANINSIFSMTNRIDNDFNIIFGIYAYHKTNDHINDAENYIKYTVVPHIDSELQQMNTTINQINNTVNNINSTSNIDTDKLNEIISNVYEIKSNTISILGNITSLNQSEQSRYTDIINDINTKSNNILSEITDLSNYLGYNQSTETLRSDIQNIQLQLGQIQNDYNQLYQLTQQINTTANSINNTLNSKITYAINLTDTPFPYGSPGFYTAKLTICSTYKYNKHFDYYPIQIPNNVYFYGAYNGSTPLNGTITLLRSGSKEFDIKNITIPADSCISYNLSYGVDPYLVNLMDNLKFIDGYYQQLYNKAKWYYDIYLIAKSDSGMAWNSLQTMSLDIEYVNETQDLIIHHPSKIYELDVNVIMNKENEILQNYMVVWDLYNYWEIENQANYILNHIKSDIEPHVMDALQQMNTTINQINQTVNEINSTSNINENKLNDILNNTYIIKNNTISILTNINGLNQSEQQRFNTIINKIDLESNQIINKVVELEQNLGYNQSNETLKSDINDLHTRLVNLQNDYNQLYQLTLQINQTSTEINTKVDLIVDKIQDATNLAIQMNQTINNLYYEINEINTTTTSTKYNTEQILNYTEQLKSQNNQIISLINGLNQSEQQRYLGIIDQINAKANHIEQLVNALQLSLGYNQSTDTLREDVTMMKSDLNDIYSLEQQLHILTSNVNSTVNNINSTVNNINSNLTYEINLLKSMYNCSDNQHNSICVKLDNIYNGILNLNNLSENQTANLKKQINELYNNLGCESNNITKECSLLININGKIPNTRPANLTTISGSFIGNVHNYLPILTHFGSTINSFITVIANYIVNYSSQLYNQISEYI